MSIALTCGCGKQMRVADEHAGRSGRCPACGQALRIPKQVAEFVEILEPAAPDPRTGLDGLSPDYSISLTEWERLARPHYGRLTGPAIGYYFAFTGIFVVIVLLHFVFIGFLLDPTLTPALAIGFHVASQALLKGQPFGFSTFFTGFRWVWPLAGRAVLLMVIPLVCLLPSLLMFAAVGLAFGNSSAKGPRRGESIEKWEARTEEEHAVAPAAAPPLVSAVTSLAFFANLGLVGYVWVRLAFFSHWLIIDRNCGPIESLKGSWLLSRGHFWGLLGTMLLVLGLVYLSAALTCGIGALFVLPRAILVLNAGYLKIAGSVPPIAPEPA